MNHSSEYDENEHNDPTVKVGQARNKHKIKGKMICNLMIILTIPNKDNGRL